MKFLPLLWAGIWRRRGRTILTLLSIVNAFLLLGLLDSFASGLDNLAGETRADVLITRSKTNMLEPLPMGLAEQIRSVPGVESVTPLIVFPTVYLDSNGPLGLAGDPEQYLAANSGMVASEGALAAMKRNRTGAIIGPGIVSQYGWKVGDRVPLTSPLWANRDGSYIWPIDIVGVLETTDSTAGDSILLLNYDYIDEGRVAAKGSANWFSVRTSDPTTSASVGASIDSLFENSPYETKTSTGQQLAQDQVSQIGDIGFVANAIAGAVFFALLFYVGTVMVQSVRERTSELGVLKALGFTDRGVLLLIVSESLLFCIVAAMIGLLLSAAVFTLFDNAFFGVPISPKGVFLKGLLLAAGLAIIGGLPPAIRAMRLSVVEALAGK